MIKAIIFDLGNVVFSDGTNLALRKFEKILNIDIEKLKGVFKEGIGKDYRLNKISEKEFWEKAFNQLGISGKISQLKDIWFSSYTPNKGMFELIKLLRKRYKLAILSNNIKERVKFLNDKYNLDSYFDISVYSCDVGISKPKPEFYKIAIQKLGFKPDECLYVDDKEKNLEPAKQVGLQTVLFRNLRQLKEELKKLRIKI